MARYVLDTNVYIDANRHAPEGEELEQFVVAPGGSIYLSAVVVQELLAAVGPASATTRLQTDVIQPYERAGRILTPSYACFKRAGQALASMIRAGLTLSKLERGFVNDVLLAASCLEAGATLVTRNVRDFGRIAKHLQDFQFALPYPYHAVT